MTEQQMSVASTAEHPESGTSGPAPHDLAHPTRAEVAEAVAASEEMNEADEAYVTELAALESGETSAPEESSELDDITARSDSAAPTAEAPTPEVRVAVPGDAVSEQPVGLDGDQPDRVSLDETTAATDASTPDAARPAESAEPVEPELSAPAVATEPTAITAEGSAEPTPAATAPEPAATTADERATGATEPEPSVLAAAPEPTAATADGPTEPAPAATEPEPSVTAPQPAAVTADEPTAPTPAATEPELAAPATAPQPTAVKAEEPTEPAPASTEPEVAAAATAPAVGTADEPTEPTTSATTALDRSAEADATTAGTPEEPSASDARTPTPESAAVELQTDDSGDLIPVPEAGMSFPSHQPSRPGGPRPNKPGGPKPTPAGGRRPSPIPRPTGTPQPGSAAPVTVEPLVAQSDPTPWGRVDDDGTVYVRTDDGERAVGFWQAGDPASGLAHYGRRYDDFMTEIVVLETRLANHAGDAKATRTHAQMLRQSIDTLPAVGDLGTAATRLDAVISASEQAISDAAADRANAKATAVARREALCVEAEALAESNQWKTSGDRLKEIVDEWRTIRGIDRKTDDLLWKRFSKARDTFIRRRGSHFAELDKERGAAKGSKEKLIERAEQLSESTDWAATATEYRTLMADWKAAGRTSRDVEDSLWDRFRAAQEKFFARRQETFASRDAEFEANAATKEALLVEAEKINPAKGLDSAKAALRSIQDRWEAAGKVPRERIRTLDARLRAVEDRIKSAEDSVWRKTDPETTARLAQFRSRYEAYKAQADKATAAGDAKRASAAQAQADQWLEWLRAAENAVD